MKYYILFFYISCFSVSGQVNGLVKDSISGKPISFVNISVENENIGSTSEENGSFIINVTSKSKFLIFSALGFEKKRVKILETSKVNLKPIAYQLDEIVISKKQETKTVEIGETSSNMYQAFDNGPKIVTKFFPYFSKYKSTKFIKQVIVCTDSQIENATFRIHFYKVDSKGFPSDEFLLGKDLIVSVSKGIKKTRFDVLDFNLKIPLEGIFVGFEKLIIEKNKLEKEIKDFNTNQIKVQKTYFPFLLFNRVENEFLYTYSGGKWHKQENNETTNKNKVNEPAINLILTN